MEKEKDRRHYERHDSMRIVMFSETLYVDSLK